MPPILMLLVTVAVIAWLFRRDFRERPNVTGALWLPTLWLLIIGSRTVAQWMQLFGLGGGGGSYEDGTPVDAAVFFVLITAGVVVLYRRHVHLGEIMSHNRWLTIFLIYCFFAILWSDFPFVAFKRWIKILGHPIMTLVLFTEPDPEEAVCRMMKRCAYIIIPVSILFIKYYPDWGRSWSPWGGEPELTGITLDKNTLGSMGLILGLYLFHRLLKTFHQEKSVERKHELMLCGSLFGFNALMLHYAKSSTSTVGMVVGMAMMLFVGRPFVTRHNLGAYIVAIILTLGVTEWLFGWYELAISLLGKDPTLTDRLPLWKEVIQMQPNVLFGAGFENFWLGERRETLWSHHWWHPIQAHNGYIETYLNLGLIGLGLMLILIFTTFSRGCRALETRYEFARFRLGFIVTFVLYNCTEAAFKATHPVWFVFYIVAIDYAMVTESPPETGPKAESAEEEVGFEGEIVA